MGPRDTSASGAMIRKIIRNVNMSANCCNGRRAPKQQKFVNTSVSTLIMFKKWRAATRDSCSVAVNAKCVPDPKSTGKCGC